MKIAIKGTITHIGEPKAAGKSNVREVILSKKYHDPDTGELKAEDNYPVQVWDDDFQSFEDAYSQSSIMEVSGFINGRLIGSGSDAKCFMNFIGKKFTPIKRN